MILSAIALPPIINRAADLSHDEIALVVAVVNGLFGIWTAYLARRNKRDIDGVAIAAKTKRAMARLERKGKKL